MGTDYHALGGAILAELLLNNLISIEVSKEKMVNLVGSTPVVEPVIDECLKKISSAKRRHRPDLPVC